jgi:hypothetical protein
LASDSFNVEAIIYEIPLIMSLCPNTFFEDRVSAAFALPPFRLAATLFKWSNQMFTCLNINHHFNTFTFIILEQSLHIVSADSFFLLGLTLHCHSIGHIATFQLYWWGKTSGALPCIISCNYYFVSTGT